MKKVLNIRRISRGRALRIAWEFVKLAFYPMMGIVRLETNDNFDEAIFTCSDEFIKHIEKIKLEAEQDGNNNSF